MSNLPGKIAKLLKRGEPAPPTPERSVPTEAYFSADVPLEGEPSDIESPSSGTISPVGDKAAAPAKDQAVLVKGKNKKSGADASSSRAEQKKGTNDKKKDKDTQAQESKDDDKIDNRNAKKRRASDILLGADLRDIIAMSALMRQMIEKGFTDEEKAERLLELQMRREEQREAEK